MISKQKMQMAKKLIKESEGCELKAYYDTEKNLTIGFGHLMKPGQKHQISQQQADNLLEKDLEIAVKRAIKMIGQEQFKKLSPQRQSVLIDLTFNMGQFKFPKFIQALISNNFDQASFQLLQSKYRVQTKLRCFRNAYIIKDNKIYTKSQAQNKSLSDGVLKKNKQGKIIYQKQIKDPNLKNILKQKNPLMSDESMAKQFDRIKRMVGGVSFDINPITTPLNGFVSQNQAIKMIEGDQYDNSSYCLMDLVTPLKIMYDQNIPSKNISVSLDPLVPTDPDGPWYKKTFYPKQLENTQYGEAMIEADFLMKQLSLGVDENNKPFQYPQRLKEMGLQIETIFKTVQQKSYGNSRTRLWIVIKDYQIGVNQKFFQVKKIAMGVELKALQVTQNGSLRDCGDDPSRLAKRFCEIFTKNYEELSEIYPVLSKIKRLAKASIIAKLMYLRRIPIDFQLINRQYNNYKCQYEQKIQRLHNSLKKQQQNKIIQMTVFGGCSFDISNIQTKINELQQQVEKIRDIYQTKPVTNVIPFKFSDKEEVGQFFFVKDQKDEIKNRQIFPFIFQSLVKCKYCEKTCNLDHYSITNKQCFDHSTMKCKICNNLILPSQKYKSNSDKSMVFHDQCFKCTGCFKEILGQFAKYQEKAYHVQCIPRKTIGVCSQCKKKVLQNEAHAKDPNNSAVYHAECAKIVNKRIQDSIPSCKECKVKIQSKYVKYQEEVYHEECIKKKLDIK